MPQMPNSVTDFYFQWKTWSDGGGYEETTVEGKAHLTSVSRVAEIHDRYHTCPAASETPTAHGRHGTMEQDMKSPTASQTSTSGGRHGMIEEDMKSPLCRAMYTCTLFPGSSGSTPQTPNCLTDLCLRRGRWDGGRSAAAVPGV